MTTMKRLTILLSVTILGLTSCIYRHAATLSVKEKEKIVLEVKTTLTTYCADVIGPNNSTD